MNKYQWAIEDVYKTEKDWEDDYNQLKQDTSFEEFRGKLNKKENFLACMKKQERLGRVLEKLYLYAHMLHDTDTRNSEYDALVSKVMSLSVEFSTNTAYIVPELTSLDITVLEGYIKDPDLAEYDYQLKTLLKEKEHVLSESEERILAQSSEALSGFREIFTKIDNADLPLETISHKGEKIPMSHGMYGVVMRSPDRALRRKCFKSYYGSYTSLMNVISATYISSVKKDVFYTKAKKFNSSLERALLGEDVDKVVYENLITSVNKALPLMHEYMKAKKTALGLSKMHMYDIYVPTEENVELELSYDDAYDLVIKALAPLGKEYQGILKQAYEDRWISVYEQKGKRSGAYSTCVYDTHPFVLLNYQPTTHDVFTIAHEMGHSIHSYFSNKSQPYSKADYKIFVSEVASTVNEVLLVRYLLNQTQDKKLKKYLLSYLLEMIRTTLFRQTQFAEFEEFAHKTVEEGGALTKDSCSSFYLQLNKKYYGKSVISDPEIAYEWARIPHFYRAFYVYKYSTGIISALAIAERILTEGESAVNEYFEFLSSGGKDSPVELLKIAGVDLTKEEAFKSAFKVFESALTEFNSL